MVEAIVRLSWMDLNRIKDAIRTRTLIADDSFVKTWNKALEAACDAIDDLAGGK